MRCRITADPMKPAPPLIKRRMLGHRQRFDDESLPLPKRAEQEALQHEQQTIVLLQARFESEAAERTDRLSQRGQIRSIDTLNQFGRQRISTEIHPVIGQEPQAVKVKEQRLLVR